MSSQPAAFHRCVGDPDVFSSEIWGRQPLLRRAADGGFDDLLSLDDVDLLVSSAGLRLPSFRLVKDGRTLQAASYTKTTRTGSQAATGVLDARAVFREFHDGATLVFQGLHRLWEPLALFCRQLERGLGHPVQANAYVTPPGSQGFDAHQDEHDVFVLQSHGSKTWRVYEKHDLPPARPPLIDTTIESGDALYIPAGFPHAAATERDASVHVTIGILTLSWQTVFDEAARLARADPALSEALPLRFAEEADGFHKLVSERLAEHGELIRRVDPETVADRVRRKFLTTRQPVLRGQMHRLLELDEINDDSSLMKRQGAICVLSRIDDEVSLLLGDRELRMPGRVEPAVRVIVERDRFAARDLSPHLDGPGRLVLVRRLVVEGLLEVVG